MSANSVPQSANFIVGSHIRARRETLRLAQVELATLTRISLTRLHAYEMGTEPIAVADLLEICCALDCTPQSLLPVAEIRAGEYVPRWMADARALNALYPRLFDTLKRMPENRLRLMLISMQAMCQAPAADQGVSEKASA